MPKSSDLKSLVWYVEQVGWDNDTGRVLLRTALLPAASEGRHDGNGDGNPRTRVGHGFGHGHFCGRGI